MTPSPDLLIPPAEHLAAQLKNLASINSHTHNLPGLAAVADLFTTLFTTTLHPDTVERIDLPPALSIDSSARETAAPLGQLLRFAHRPAAPKQVLLVIHYDTVYEREHPFQCVSRESDAILKGPGVADAKGGIIVLLHALAAFERLAASHPALRQLGWEVLLNPDEEIGSPGSAEVLAAAARRNHLGLVFEPAPTATHLVTGRKGSGNFTAIFHGKSAHAGREIHKGRNAIMAAARFALAATDSVSAISPEVTINCSRIEGGGPANVVPDLAIVRFNVRASTSSEKEAAERELANLLKQANQQDGIRAELHGHFSSPPWVMDETAMRHFARLQKIAESMNLALEPATSGGASDANKLAAAGLPTLDSLGPVGHDIHSPSERVEIPSLRERAALVSRFLTDFALTPHSHSLRSE